MDVNELMAKIKERKYEDGQQKLAIVSRIKKAHHYTGDASTEQKTKISIKINNKFLLDDRELPLIHQMIWVIISKLVLMK